MEKNNAKEQYSQTIEEIKNSATERLPGISLEFDEVMDLLAESRENQENIYIMHEGYKQYALLINFAENRIRQSGGVENKTPEYERFEKLYPSMMEIGKQVIPYEERFAEWSLMLRELAIYPMPRYEHVESFIEIMADLTAGKNPAEVLAAYEGNNKVLSLVLKYHKDGPELLEKHCPKFAEAKKDAIKLTRAENMLYAENAALQTQPNS